jgi:hypothetical protein
MNRNTVLLIAAVGVIAVIGLALSQVASGEPDGLEFVAQSEGFDDAAENHSLSDGALADYGENLGGSESTNTAVAALVGIGVTALAAGGLFWLTRTRNNDPTAAS